MSEYITVSGLRIAKVLLDFVDNEALPGSGISSARFWAGAAQLIALFSPLNRELLHKRNTLQQQIDQWHQTRTQHEPVAYKQFLERIGYLLPEPAPVKATTENVDPEIALLAGPQLVVPLSNPRFALNAVNARWGSLYDALYGSDVISEANGAERGQIYNPVRGQQVIAFSAAFLDTAVPLASGSHTQALGYRLQNGQLVADLRDTSVVPLLCADQLLGYRGKSHSPEALLLHHYGLHIELQLDASVLTDVLIEAALTCIMDCEDSVAAVDAEDKVQVYRTWLELMKGTLQAQVTKDHGSFTRTMNPDRTYMAPNGSPLILAGRALMFVRNVGLLMTSDAILDAEGQEVAEGILDALITSLAALHNLDGHTRRPNSRTGSIYIVKPKMHGPEEVAFTNALFEHIEQVLHLPGNTLKLGIMDEERRTTVNLKACIQAVSERVVFINTGFLDRTGDEIHTSMEAGAMVRKAAMKTEKWIGAYENWNVDIGLSTGLPGRAQIGKGMWAMPDMMAAMLEQKIAHPLSGANTAWVPSPTAAVLHALHYHQVDVFAQQRTLAARPRASLDDILAIPLAPSTQWSDEEIRHELDNNAQGILGYIVRWIDQGIGCSKVPDINNTGLMEDRATLRISSQHMANWLRHGVISQQQIIDSFQRMAAVVDQQNAHDPVYRPIAGNFDNNIAFQTALELVLEGTRQPNGYTEPVLHRRRRAFKASVPD